MLKRILVLAALALSACTPQDAQKIKEVRVIDQCLRTQIFKDCLVVVPKGPERIANSNDWEEVVTACADAAMYQSVRQAGQVKAECAIVW
jgi:hypothetical protein